MLLPELKPKINALLPELTADRQHLHTMPELLYDLPHTAEFVANKLTEYGYVVQKNVGRIGVVAILDSGKPGKTVALRGDMDALPIQEATNLPYASKSAGKMHACGHDGHTVTLLAAAQLLPLFKDKFSGKVKFIFQPAEEGGNGAQAMIDDGVLNNPKVDAIFGYHNWPKTAFGKIQTKVGAILAGFSRFEITVHGKVGHVAMPHTAINPVLIAAELIRELQAKVTDLLTTADPKPVINITYINAGKPRTGMTDQAEIMGYLYAAEASDIAAMKQRVQAITQAVIAKYVNDAAQATADVLFHDVYSPTVNTAAETELAFKVATQLFGAQQVMELPATIMASEDFSAYLQQVPGCFFFLGTGEDQAGLHTNTYDFNDAALVPAAQMLCELAVTYLNQK